MLGVTVDKRLKYEEHIVKQCKKAGQKRSALARVCKILNQECRKTSMKAFIESQFRYCPVICKFCGRNLKNRISHLHEKSPRIIYNVYESEKEEQL